MAPEEHPVLLTEAPLNPKANREKVAQVMFETSDFPLHVLLFASGCTTSVALDSGHEVSATVLNSEANSLSHAFPCLNFAGRDLTDWLMELLTGLWGLKLYETSRGSFTTWYLAPINETVTAATSSSLRKTYKMPDALFKPNHPDMKCNSIHESTYRSIIKCKTDIRKGLCSNVLLSGGCSICPGFVKRFAKDLTALKPNTMKVKVIAPSESKYSAWISGSIPASLSTF
ncbi:unnamed protein product [Taenia asiatica]|uniref:Actin-like n=1 Tax=Taenia asiatica TaxID=60517 RepID=A0A0R3WB17_TAEAS|nr:unnamed protein product [Taenia asiatica]